MKKYKIFLALLCGAGFTSLISPIGLVAPVAILVVLACVPSLDPLWPSGMDLVAKTETGLKASFPNGISIEEARSILKPHGVAFSEMAGPTLVGKTHTGAFDFPCGFEIQVVLSFDASEKLKERDIHRVRICP